MRAHAFLQKFGEDEIALKTDVITSQMSVPLNWLQLHLKKWQLLQKPTRSLLQKLISPLKLNLGLGIICGHFTDPVFKIRLQEDPASHLVFASLTLSYPKPTNDNVSALCSIGEMYDQLQLQDLMLTWDIALVSASQLAVEPIKVNGYKGIKVNTAYETKPTEWWNKFVYLFKICVNWVVSVFDVSNVKGNQPQ